MVRRCAPTTVQQLHSSELFQHNAAPVGRRTRRSAFTFSAVLIAQHTQFAFLVSASLWAKQPRESVIAGSNRRLLAIDAC